jgi:hypothetical protein
VPGLPAAHPFRTNGSAPCAPEGGGDAEQDYKLRFPTGTTPREMDDMANLVAHVVQSVNPDLRRAVAHVQVGRVEADVGELDAVQAAGAEGDDDLIEAGADP